MMGTFSHTLSIHFPSSLSFSKHFYYSIITSTSIDDTERHSNGAQFLISMRHLCRSGQVKNFDEALNLFQGMAGMKPLSSVKDLHHCISLVEHVSLQFWKIKEVGSLLDEMMKMRMVPDLQTLNILVNAFCKEGKVMQAKCGFCQAGRPFAAKELFFNMQKHGQVPNIQTCAVILNGLCKASLLSEAVSLVEDPKLRTGMGFMSELNC
ncbi:hypothetical protein VNO80_10588 [Phaseolus coccineus]|uniref:Pentatricopeptide repeat-containing protein n=1 Tax=Phaseolus coccineus TaxID=3886 RepID=A0AAN9NA26_PHACN